MHKIKMAAIVIFCAMLAGGMAVSMGKPQREYSETENRTLETKPQLSLSDVLSGEYQEHYEKYLNDQMFLRDSWVKLAVNMERLTGKRDINGVYLGKDGYLLEKYAESDFDDAQVDENIQALSRFLNDTVQEYGEGRVTCLLLPSKANAMPAKLPDRAGMNTAEGATVAKLRQALDTPKLLLDAAEELQKHQAEYIYYRTDHHWTPLGAYYAYCMWAQATGRKARPLEAYDREVVFSDFYGTTYNKVQIAVPPDQVELFHSKGEDGLQVIEDHGELVSDSMYFIPEASAGFNRYNVFFSKNTANIEIHTKAETNRALLVIKDSFANCFVPHLVEDFDEIIMADFRYGKENIYDLLKEHTEITDVLVMYNIEKFMQDTNLRALSRKADTMQEFNMEDFFSDTQEGE